MKDSNSKVKYDQTYETREYRKVTIERNRSVKAGDKGCYHVNGYECASIIGAQEYIDSMIEACGIEFFQIKRKNALIEDEV